MNERSQPPRAACETLATADPRAGTLSADWLLVDNHTYISPVPGTPTLAQIERHRAAGFHLCLVNLGDAHRPLDHLVRMLGFCRQWIEDHPDRFILLRSMADLDRAKQEAKLAVGFNVEGVFALGDQPELVALLGASGVRWMLFVYNRRNLAGSGVHDAEDLGLTPLGRRMAEAMDRVGVIKCLSHTGPRTAMEVLEASPLPCIFSHSNALALKAHPRNISDSLIKACAASGGVVGVNGVNIFLGQGPADPLHMADHIDYIAQLVGIDHVGIGLDYGYIGDASINDEVSDPHIWPPGNDYDKPMSCVPPEDIGVVAAALARRGYDDEAIGKVMGANMRRVMAAVWGDRKAQP